MTEPAFFTWASQEEKDKVFNNFSSHAYDYEFVKGSHGRTFIGTNTNTSVRSEYGRQDYNYYRPGETVPTKIEDIIAMSLTSYRRVGIVHNVIELMSDFGSKGIRLVHEDTKEEKFYRNWFNNIVHGPERSNAFLNLFYKGGNVIAYRMEGQITIKKMMDSTLDGGRRRPKLSSKYQVPLKYVFYHPLSVEVVGGELASFAGKPVLALRVTPALRTGISKAQALAASGLKEYQDLLRSIPKVVMNAINNGAKFIPLDQDALSVYHYKKNDWDVWAEPIIAPILSDLIMLEKLELADSSALDGAVSNIRHWKIGSLADKIIPNKVTLNRFRNMLANNVGGGVMDLVTGPEVDFKESNTQVYKFLGEGKYTVTLNKIYSGLGVPPTLTGSGGTGTTNNFIALKTLIDRLEYGRRILTDFWTIEIERVRKVMGFKKPAKITFDYMVLSDEAAEKRLLIELADRDLISGQSLQERFNLYPEVENIRIARETEDRNSEKMPPKSSPYHNPNTEAELRKIILQQGGVAPSELGVELLPRKEGEKTPNEEKHESLMEQAKFKPQGQNGRPVGTKDSTKRKKRTFKPGAKANFIDNFIWANEAQKEISELVNPIFLESVDKKNLRNLTTSEVEQLELMKYHALCRFKPNEPITLERVYNFIVNSDSEAIEVANNKFNKLSDRFQKKTGRKPTYDELKQIRSSAYALVKES